MPSHNAESIRYVKSIAIALAGNRAATDDVTSERAYSTEGPKIRCGPDGRTQAFADRRFRRPPRSRPTRTTYGSTLPQTRRSIVSVRLKGRQSREPDRDRVAEGLARSARHPAALAASRPSWPHRQGGAIT